MEAGKQMQHDESLIGAFDGTWQANGPSRVVKSPIDGTEMGRLVTASAQDCERVITEAHKAFLVWREVPAPKRAEVVRQIGEALRREKEELALLVTREMGKHIREARGEVQEMIDICDFATGLGRQVGGSTLPSERAGHRLMEQWHPLGVVGIVTAFNFPVAVWAWNMALALVCGDSVIWKPSSKTPLAAIACNRLAARVLAENGYPQAVASLVIGRGREIGDLLINDSRVALVSYTGSVATGRDVGVAIQRRFGRSLLELGGNGAVIVSEKGDLDQALESVYFGAIGTSGQRCTSTRRVIVQQSILPKFIERLVGLLSRTRIGDPREADVHMGPLVDAGAVDTMMAAIATAQQQGGKVLFGGQRLDLPGGCYVTPCLIEAGNELPIVQEETFAPVLYVMPYTTLEHAIVLQNGVTQGLSSAIFTRDLLEAERFVGPAGSDCGLANVNAGTSGAEIGGAFGGEKETGGGREAGSDSWKAYMRRQTNVINGSGRTELAQGIKLDL